MAFADPGQATEITQSRIAEASVGDAFALLVADEKSLFRDRAHNHGCEIVDDVILLGLRVPVPFGLADVKGDGEAFGLPAVELMLPDPMSDGGRCFTGVVYRATNAFRGRGDEIHRDEIWNRNDKCNRSPTHSQTGQATDDFSFYTSNIQ